MNVLRNDHEIICGCASLNRSDALSYISRNSDMDFDEFLQKTGAGRTCTACMLDLEFLFVDAPKSGNARVKGSASLNLRERLSVKRRLYELLDRFPVRIPFNVTNWMPVLYGGGLSQFLFVSNFPLLYGNALDVSDYRIGFKVRNGDGAVVHQSVADLPVGEMLRVNLSRHLPPANDLSSGSISLDRKAVRPGVRGTTRPQVEFVTDRAASSVHFQASGDVKEHQFTFRYRPAEEEILFSVVNCTASRISARANYSDHLSPDNFGIDTINLPAFGSGFLSTVGLPNALPAGMQVDAKLTCSGRTRLHVVSISRDRSRISVDHI